MKKENNTEQKILEYIQKNTQATPKEMADSVQVSPQMIHRSLKKLVEEGMLDKLGTAPQVYYALKKDKSTQKEKTKLFDGLYEDFKSREVLAIDMLRSTSDIIEKNFYIMTPDGRELFGVEAFISWCTQRKYDVVKKAQEYIETYKKYNSGNTEKKGLDATSKILNSFTKENIYLDKLIYLYPYSLPVFGKTKISEMLFHAKQNQDDKLMKRVFDMMHEKLIAVITDINSDAIGFIPPTLSRKKQLMKELQSYLQINTPLVKIEKIKTPITIQQKSLKNIADRIVNADHTMVVLNTKQTYKRILLIDDFTGSGSTLNQVAKKCKLQGVAKEVVGLTLTGSLNGFDVIREI